MGILQVLLTMCTMSNIPSSSCHFTVQIRNGVESIDSTVAHLQPNLSGFLTIKSQEKRWECWLLSYPEPLVQIQSKSLNLLRLKIAQALLFFFFFSEKTEMRDKILTYPPNPSPSSPAPPQKKKKKSRGQCLWKNSSLGAESKVCSPLLVAVTSTEEKRGSGAVCYGLWTLWPDRVCIGSQEHARCQPYRCPYIYS